jgi:hypothetical protein
MNMEVFGLVQYILWLLFTLAFLLAAVAFTHYVSSDAVGMCGAVVCYSTPKSEVHVRALGWSLPLYTQT